MAILFGGIGGESVGALKSRVEYGGKVYKYKLLCSIDSDPVACKNHDLITGEDVAVCMDLFTRWQYRAWHGQEPPADWREVTPWDIWQAFQEQVPFFLFSSPPCKGLSGLLPQKSATSEKYQALNYLTVHGLDLALRACDEYGGKVPAIIQLENVPRITTRGASHLKQIKMLLKKFGYAVSIRPDHNLGAIGGLGQNRVRFLIMARHEAQVPNFINYPAAKKMKTIGDVIGPLPAPDDIKLGGPLHRLPKLEWKTWLRLALIPAGGDWRDLQHVDYKNLRVVHEPRRGAYEVADWDKPSRAVTSTAGPGRSNGVAALSDPRMPINSDGKANLFRVQVSDAPATCVTGAVGPSQGAGCISDPSLSSREGRHPGVYRIVRMEDISPCVTGSRHGSEALAVADPRINSTPRSGTYGVQRWSDTAKTVTGSADVHAGTSAVADPRPIPKDKDRGIFIIIAPDGTVHRPLTTYELAMIQSFPLLLPDGRPFQLTDCSDQKAREYIGNAVPPDASEAMCNVTLLAAAQADAGDYFVLSFDPVWVAPEAEFDIPAFIQ